MLAVWLGLELVTQRDPVFGPVRWRIGGVRAVIIGHFKRQADIIGETEADEQVQFLTQIVAGVFRLELMPDQAGAPALDRGGDAW